METYEIFEAIMLICFGLSWPMSVYKNIKAKTAKSMSLPFILLITFGYVAGISAKFISHNISYVLVVYIINIAIVSVNIVVYFINKNYDKKAAMREVAEIKYSDNSKVRATSRKAVLK